MTDRNYKNIVYGFYKDLYHPFKLIENLEELRVVAFCKRTPKIANKFPHEKMPKDGLEEVYTIDRNGNFLNKKGGLLMETHNFVLTSNGKLKIGEWHHF